MQFLKYWPYGLAALAILVLSCFISYCFGVSEGIEQEEATQAVIGIKQVGKATSDREEVEHETRGILDGDLIRDMRSNGWLRD